MDTGFHQRSLRRTLRPGPVAGAGAGGGADVGVGFFGFAVRDGAVEVFWRLGAAWEGFWEGLGRFILGVESTMRGEKNARSVCTLVACGSARWKFLEGARSESRRVGGRAPALA